jgi:hypothetical protein
MFRVKNKKQCKEQSSAESCKKQEVKHQKKHEKQCEEPCEKPCEKPCEVPSQPLTICELRGVAELVKNYNNVNGQFPLSDTIQLYLLMVQEAKYGPKVTYYTPHLVGKEPHCQSFGLIKSHFNYTEVAEFQLITNNLPNNTDWNIQILPTNFDINRYTATPEMLDQIVKIVPKDLTLVTLKFGMFPEKVCKGDEVPEEVIVKTTIEEEEIDGVEKGEKHRPKSPCSESSSSSSSSSDCDENDFTRNLNKPESKSSSCSPCPVPLPSAPVAYNTGVINAHIHDNILTISESDVENIMSNGPGVLIIFKPTF